MQSVFLMNRFSFLRLGKRAALTLDNVPRFHHAAHAGQRINLAVPADNRARIEHAVAADFGKIAEHRAELLAPGFVIRLAVDNDVLFIAFDVAGYGSRAHVRFIAQNGIADVIIVRGLHAVEKDDGY